MAARTVRLFQDQNVIDHVNDAGTMSIKTDFAGKMKSRAGGRKPLGDLSNAVKPIDIVDGKKVFNGSTIKPSVNQTPNLLKSKNNPTIVLHKDKEVVSAKGKNLEINKRTGSKASKKSNTGSRRALTDISNSLHVPDMKNKDSLDTSSFKGKYLHPDAIAEERMFHNHEECIKSQSHALDMHHFFKTAILGDDLDDDMKISFEQPAFSKLKSDDAFLELKEMPEELPDMPSPSAKHGSPVCCKSPEFSRISMWDDPAFDCNFTLIESPKSSKN